MRIKPIVLFLLGLCSLSSSLSLNGQSPIFNWDGDLQIDRQFPWDYWRDADQYAPGPAGADQTWIFSDYQGLDYQVFRQSDPAETPFAAQFPSANLCQEVLDRNAYTYYLAGGSLIQELGYRKENEATVVYDDPKDLLWFPFTYGDVRVDSFSGSWNFRGQAFRLRGEVRHEVDGYGRLDLYRVPVEGMLRIKTTEVYVEESAGQIDTVRTERYAWYSTGETGYPRPWLELGTLARGGVATSFARAEGAIIVCICPPGLDDEFLNIYPNPAIGSANLWYFLDKPAVPSLQVFDASGALVLERPVGPKLEGEYFTELDLKGLESGVYLVVLGVGENRYSKRLVISASSQ